MTQNIIKPDQELGFLRYEVDRLSQLAEDRRLLLERLLQEKNPDINIQLTAKATEYYKEAQANPKQVSDFLRGALCGMRDTLEIIGMNDEVKYCAKMGLQLRWRQNEQAGEISITRKEEEIS